jgi:NADPH-dependent curcumin reductase CurA
MARAWHLERRPQGMPVANDFALRDIALAPLDDGQVRVRNLWLSVDPYMRGRMNDVKSYAAPFALGEPMTGGAVGEVIESRADGLSPGDRVVHMAGWRDEAVIAAREAQKLPPLDAPPQAFLGQLGMPGMTAYFGLLLVAEAKAGDTVFVSAAAGAVGSTVVQIAKARGMTVIGSAGGADKCDWVRSLGADHVIDYKTGDSIVRQLAAAAPQGIDVYFDNVGGDHLDAAFATAREGARFAICGMIDIYNSGAPTQLRYIARTIAARIRIQGFLVSDWLSHAPDFYRDMGELLAKDALRREETVVEGLEAMPDAFLGLFSGANRGKMLVRV